MNIVIIGGGPAGSIAAIELRKQLPDAGITVLEKAPYHYYSACAFPYFLSGELSLEQPFKELYEQNNIILKLGASVTKINDNSVICNNEEVPFDKLVIATGSRSVVVPFKGLKAGFRTLNNYEDVKRMKDLGDKIVIVGGGAIGVELAYSLRKKQVTIIEMKDSVMSKNLSSAMGEVVVDFLKKNKVNVVCNSKVKEIKGKTLVHDKGQVDFDDLIISCGTVPVIVGDFKEYKVNDFMQVRNNIYAIGDCALVKHAVTGERVYSGLASVALQQAKVAAAHIAGNPIKYPGALGAYVTKLGSLIVGSTGVNEGVCAKVSNKGTTVRLCMNDAKEVVGCEVVSDTNVSGLIDLVSFAILNKTKVSELARLECCYNPCLVPLINPLVACASILARK